MTEYKHVQFIAFNIRPGYKTVPAKKCWQCGCAAFNPMSAPNQDVCEDCYSGSTSANRCYGEHKDYLGVPDHVKDIEYRSKVIKKAIETAYHKVDEFKSSNLHIARRAVNKVDTNKTLYVFMAPEFYYRGAEGAYPVEHIHTIMEQMREEIDFPSYKDWLFIFGTAIGYLKHEETSVKITSIKNIPPNKIQITVDSLLESDWTQAKASEYLNFEDCSDSSKSPVNGPINVSAHTKGVQTTIKDINHDTGDRFIITLDTTKPCPVGNSIYFYREGFTQTKKFEIKDSTQDPNDSSITIENPDQHKHDPCPKCSGDKCSSFEPLPAKPDNCRKCTHTHSNDSANYIRKNQVAKMESSLILDTDTGFAENHFVKLVAGNGKTEIGNYALISKGGSKQVDTDEPKQFVIYKEYISSIDFLRDESKDWDNQDERLIAIHGHDDRKVLPTEGSQDLNSAAQNIAGTTTTYLDEAGKKKEHKISEINKVGYGGGSVFTIDDITFGLEVCLDHAYDRVWDFYNNYAHAGDPKVQIHLIPSWGMSIGGGKIACVDEGLVFNVDGPSGSVLRINDGKYYCEKHKDVQETSVNTCPKSSCNEQLQPIGMIIKSLGNESVTHPKIKQYFENEGKIVVYEEQQIPSPETV